MRFFLEKRTQKKKHSNRLYSPTCSRTPRNQHMHTKKDNHLPKHRGRYPCPLVITNVFICYPPSARHRVKAHTNDVQPEETWSLKRFDNDNVGHIFKLSAPNSWKNPPARNKSCEWKTSITVNSSPQETVWKYQKICQNHHKIPALMIESGPNNRSNTQLTGSTLRKQCPYLPRLLTLCPRSLPPRSRPSSYKLRFMGLLGDASNGPTKKRPSEDLPSHRSLLNPPKKKQQHYCWLKFVSTWQANLFS